MINRNGQNFYNINEVANNLKVSIASVYKLIKSHSDLLEGHVKQMKAPGDKRLKKYISEEGLYILMNVKGDDRGNQNKVAPSAKIQKDYKKAVVEKAIEAHKPKQELGFTGSLTDMAKALLAACELAEKNQQELKELRGDVAMLKGDTSKYPIRKGQRDVLNERVRGFAYGVGVDFPKVWKKLHEQVGRRSLDDYVFEDYQLALHVIGEWSKQYQLDF